MATVTVTIGAISRSVLPGTLNISQTLFQRSTCEFSIPDRSGDITLSVGEPVTVKELAHIWFGGTITEVERVKSVAGSPRYLRVRAVDFSQTCDRRITGSRTWTNAKLTTIVRDIAIESLDNEGLDLSLIPPNQGPVVAEFKVDYEPVSDAYNRLCSQVSAYWRIDKSKRLIAQEFSAGFLAGAISDVSGNVVAGSLQSRETREQFANHVIVRFNNLVGTYTKSFTGDSIKKTFDVEHEIVGAPQISIGSADDPENYTWVSVQVEGSSEPDPNAEYYAAYWSAGSKTITLSKPLAASLPMEVTYKGKSVDMRDVISADSINARKVVEGNSGVYTRVINIDQEITPATAEEIANAAISRFVQLSTTVTFESDQLIAAPGDRITSSFSGVPAGTYVVRGVRTSLVGKDLVRSAIEMSSGNLILDGMESLGALAGYVPGVGSLPITSDVEPAFPNVTNFTVVPSQVEIDGVLKYNLEGSYTVPASTEAAKFGGVHLYLRDSGRIIDLGYQPTSVAAGRTATFTVILRLPPADTDWTLYAVARDKRRSNVFDPTSTPQATIAAKAKPLNTIPDVLNFKAGTEIGGVWTNSWYWDDLGSTLHCDWSADVPADKMNWSGLVLWLRDGSGEYVQATGTEFIASGTLTGTLSLSSEFIPASGSYTVIASSCDRGGNVKRVGGNPAGPSITVPVPVRPVTSGGTVLPGDVSNVQLTYGYEPDTSFAGGQALWIQAVYTAPVPATAFTRVHLYYERPDQSFAPVWLFGMPLNGQYVMSGDWTPTSGPVVTHDPARSLAIIRGLDPALNPQSIRVYVVSGNESAENKLVRANQPNATPSATITVQPPTTARISGEEFARVVTLTSAPSAVIKYSYDNAGNQFFQYDLSWALPNPTDPDFTGVVITEVSSEFGERDLTGGVAWGETRWISERFPVPSSRPVELRLYSYSEDPQTKRNTFVRGLTPSTGTLYVQRQNVAVDQPYAPNVTDVSAEVYYETSEIGARKYGFLLRWKNPLDDRYKGVKPIVRPVSATDASQDIPLGIETEGSTYLKTTSWDCADYDWTVQVYFVSIDANNRANPINAGTPKSAQLTVTKGTGTLKLNRADASTLGSDMVVANDKLTVLAVSASKLTDVDNAEFHMVDGVFKLKTVNLATKAVGFDTSLFKITGNVFTIDSIDAGLVKTGILWIGNSKASKLAVFSGNTADAANMIAFMGQERNLQGTLLFEGLWAKRAAIGGTSYSNAPILADAFGNVAISGATFQLYLNGVTTSIQNISHSVNENGTVVSRKIGLKVAQTLSSIGELPMGTFSSVVPGRFSVFNNSATPTELAYIGTPDGNRGSLFMTQAGSVSWVRLDTNIEGTLTLASAFGSAILSTTSLTIANQQVVGSRKSAVAKISDYTSGSQISFFLKDWETLYALKAAVNSLIDRLNSTTGHGLIT